MGIINKAPVKKNILKTQSVNDGFRHDISVHINLDGSTTPTSIILGNKGDKSITCITFDLEELVAADFCSAGLDAYIHKLVCSNGDELECRYTSSEHNSYCILPASLCNESGTISLIYELIESNPPSGNIEKREIFISNLFYGTVHSTEWDDSLITLIDQATPQTDLYQCLTKNNIIINTDTLNYQIHTDTIKLGNKFDNYITRIVFSHKDSSYEPLSEQYALFKINEMMYVTKFQIVDDENLTIACWIPSTVLQTAGNVIFFIVTQTSDKTKRWVSNSLIMKVEDNFLTAPVHYLEIYGPNEAYETVSFTLRAECDIPEHEYTWTASGINLTPNGNECYCVGNNTGEYTIYCQCNGAQASHEVTITPLILRTETYTFSEHFSSNTPLNGVNIDINYYLSLNFDRNIGGTAPQYYSNGSSARLYTGNKMGIMCKGGKIKRIVFTFASGGTDNRDFNIDVGEYHNLTWIGESNRLNCVVVDTQGTATGGHVRLSSLEITYYVN